jgi:hypothetical protein
MNEARRLALLRLKQEEPGEYWELVGLVNEVERRERLRRPLRYAVVLGEHGRSSDAPRDGKGRYLPRSSKADNLIRTGYGTSTAYTLARLDRDGHHRLAARVRSGRMSANAAAIEAGYRKRPR